MPAKQRGQQRLYLVAHTNEDGTGAAQAHITARSEAEAKSTFRALYPGRTLQTVGVKAS